jgi:hypothetical protein
MSTYSNNNPQIALHHIRRRNRNNTYCGMPSAAYAADALISRQKALQLSAYEYDIELKGCQSCMAGLSAEIADS